jgi:hypothetical protein
MKPIIVIIEDVSADINKIKNLFPSRYDFYPVNQEEDNSFINNVRNSIDNNYSNRNQAENDVKNQLTALSNKIAAFIVDYKLTSVEERKITKSGLKFYQDFISTQYPTKPCMILTHLKAAKEINNILDEIDKINDRNKLTLRLKELDDANFQNSVMDFVKRANPILQLIEKIKAKEIRNRIDTLNQTLCDIKTNYQNYKDNIVQVLIDFANCTSEIDCSKQNEFITNCNENKIS